MNNYILINKTYCEVTPESAQDGDFSDSGMIEKNIKVSFSELVQLMREFSQPSCSPCDGDINTWFSSGFYTSDYSTGTEREESIHFSRDNSPNAAKYWKWAYMAEVKRQQKRTEFLRQLTII